MVKSLSLTGNIKLIDGSTDVLSDALSIVENYTEVTVQDLTIAAAGADVAINFAGVTTAQLIILVPTYASSSTEYMSMKVNAGSEAIKFGKIAILGGNGANGTTAIAITNPDASNPVQMKVYIA